MENLNYILATAGHIDHGKSAIVKALTHVDPDRLPEEKKRGITIELGFAHIDLQSTNEPESTFHLGIVDVPGHEDFVKNMVAGVGSIDVALIVVAANDGWMPQTEEHFQILNYLGVTRAVVALNKMDLADTEADFLIELIREELKGSPMAQAPIVPLTATTGQGVDDLKQALSAVLAETPAPHDIGKPRLFVDRTFSVKGIGTVATGTLSGGRIEREQSVIVQPGEIASRVRSIQNHNHEIDIALPGTRTAVNLAGVELLKDSRAAQSGIGRGYVVTLPDIGEPCRVWDVVISKSTRLQGKDTAEGRPLKHDTIVRIHHGSGNVPARVLLLDVKQIAAGDRAIAQLRLNQPVLAYVGDHFIIRDWSEAFTIGGGIVLDANPDPRHFRNTAQREFLTARSPHPTDLTTMIQTQVERDHLVNANGLLRNTRFSGDEIAEGTEQLIGQGTLIRKGGRIAVASWWNQLRQRAIDIIETYHREHPERPGLPLTDFKNAFRRDGAVLDFFDDLLSDLQNFGCVVAAKIIRRSNHQIKLPPKLQASATRIRDALTANLTEPPARKHFENSDEDRQAVRYLIDSGEAIEIGTDLVLLTSGYDRIRAVIVGYIEKNGPATVSDLRQALGVSRRIALPVLEYLDSIGITRRQGDVRALP